MARGCLWKPLVATTVLVACTITAWGMLDRAARDASFDICERSDLDLVRAAGAGDAPAVRRELAAHAADAHDRYDNTALGCAIPRARADVIDVLLVAGANPDEPTGHDTFRELPNELALDRGDDITLATLLDHGSNPNLASPGKPPPLVRAVRERKDAAVDLLLDHHADPDVQGDDIPLVIALDAGSTDAFDSLLRHGADPTGTPGRRPVVAAARLGSSAGYQQLVDHGADLSVPAEVGGGTTVADRALLEAAGAGSLPIVDDLLARGADPDREAYLGPLLRSVAFRHHEVARRLIEAGADPDRGEADEVTLSFTLATLDPGLAHRFDTTHGTLLSTSFPAGLTDLSQLPRLQVPPIAAAIAGHDDDTAAMLLAHGADPNRIAADDYSPLYLAAATCNPTATRALLAAGGRAELAPPGFEPAGVACPAVREVLDR